LIGRDVSAYARNYGRYFERNTARHEELRMLDPAPRYCLDPDLGLLAFGESPGQARAVRDIAVHTMGVISAAEDLGSYQPVSEQELFDVEYWELEQAKLRRTGSKPPLQGRVALVTGAASGIGRACADELLKQGAAVVGVDRSEAVHDVSEAPAYVGAIADVTDPDALGRALATTVEAFGGLDIVVPAAGVFPKSAYLDGQNRENWERAMAVNATAVHEL